MSFAGIKKPEELADLIAYLRSLAAEPLPLPDKAEAEMPAAAPEGGGEQLSLQEILTTPIYELDGHQQARKHLETQRGLKVRLAIEQELVGQELFLKERIDAALPERGAELAQSCAGCHSWDAKGADLIGPNLFGVLGREVGSRESYDYSECLSSFTDPKRAWTFWSFQLFIEFLAQPANQLGDCGEDHPIVSEHDERIALAAFFRLQGAQPYLIE
jgi:cytochrome c